MLFLPEGQDFVLSGPGQCGCGSVEEDEVGKGKEKVRETEPESEDKIAGPSVRNKILTDLLEEQRLHNHRLLGEIAQIRGALFQMGKMLKGVVHNTNDITDHLLSKEDDDGRQIVGGAIINVDEESADGEEAEQGEVSTKETEGEKGQEVEGEKEVEAADETLL